MSSATGNHIEEGENGVNDVNDVSAIENDKWVHQLLQNPILTRQIQGRMTLSISTICGRKCTAQT